MTLQSELDLYLEYLIGIRVIKTISQTFNNVESTIMFYVTNSNSEYKTAIMRLNITAFNDIEDEG
jgi:hypothetical protein